MQKNKWKPIHHRQHESADEDLIQNISAYFSAKCAPFRLFRPKKPEIIGHISTLPIGFPLTCP
jgi:hypothetical protein